MKSNVEAVANGLDFTPVREQYFLHRAWVKLSLAILEGQRITQVSKPSDRIHETRKLREEIRVLRLFQAVFEAPTPTSCRALLEALSPTLPALEHMQGLEVEGGLPSLSLLRGSDGLLYLSKLAAANTYLVTKTSLEAIDKYLQGETPLLSMIHGDYDACHLVKYREGARVSAEYIRLTGMEGLPKGYLCSHFVKHNVSLRPVGAFFASFPTTSG